LYWKQLVDISPDNILANRIIWSFVFVLIIVVFKGRLSELQYQISKNIGQSTVLFFCGLIISANWFTYIYAVNTNHIVEASLGYYISPLLTIFLGRVVLKETLSFFQWISVILAGIGVGIMTISFGSIPVIALILAFSFSIYGLLKKRIEAEVDIGLALETLAPLPLAFGYLVFLYLKGESVYSNLSYIEMFFLLGTGVITVIPLMLFSYGAKRIPLTTVGFIQYIAPTISLFLGLYLYNETFTRIHLVTFTFIWIALFLYTFSQIRLFTKIKNVTNSQVKAR
jgi:chloramphenicol-sensitive protein RarD